MVLQKIGGESGGTFDHPARRGLLPVHLREVREDVERPLREEAGNTGNFVEPLHDEASPPVEFGPPLPHEILRPVERLDGGLVAEGYRVAGALALDVVHRRDKILVGSDIPDSPAGHRVGLGQPVDDDRPFPDLFPERGDADEPEPVVDELFVDVVGQYRHVAPYDDIRDPFQLLPRVCRPGGVGGAVQDNALRPGRDRLVELSRRQLESRFLLRVDDHRGGTGQQDDVGVGDPVGGGDDDLVPFLEKRLGDVIDGVLRPHGDDDVLPLVLQAIVAPEFRDDGILELGGSGHRSIFRVAVVQGLLGHRLDVFRGVEVRFAGPEPHDVDSFRLHGLCLARNGQRGGWLNMGDSSCEFHRDALLYPRIGDCWIISSFRVSGRPCS